MVLECSKNYQSVFSKDHWGLKRFKMDKEMPCMSKQKKITFTWFKKGSSLKHNNELILSIYVNNELILSRKVFAEKEYFVCHLPTHGLHMSIKPTRR